MRRLSFIAAAAFALVISAGLTAKAITFSQRVLVYCPPADTNGCGTIVDALGNADRGYDGTDGTVDLRSADLSSYAVVIIPSLADDGELAPYAFLRNAEVAAHLRQSVLGRRVFWSGTPDQGSTNREAKDALLSRLAEWAGGNHVAVRAPGLLVLQDASTSAHYNWVTGLTGINVIADPAIRSYSAVRAVTAIGTAIVGDAAYTNMASRGFYLPMGAAGISLDAVGNTGTSVGGQIVLMTHPGAAESAAVVATDKDDYAPGESVAMTGSGFLAGESVLLTLLEDPEVHEARTFTVTADSSGTFSFGEFAPENHDIGVRFILTATGQTSGRTAETTFTDDHVLEMVVMPANVPASSSADYVLVINLRSNITVGRVVVTHEGSWSGVSIASGSTVASAGKSWSASYSGSQITLVAATSTDRLTATGQTVAVRFTANTSSSSGTKAWQAQGWSNLTATGTNHAIPDQKLNIGSNDRSATVGITPAIVGGGSSNVHTVTITRTVGGDPLGSVGLTVPSGFTITAMSAITEPAGKTWTGVFDAGTRFIRLLASDDNSRLSSNGQAISFTLTLTAPVGAAVHNLRVSAWKGFHFDDDPFGITTQPTVTTTSAGPTKLAYTSLAHTGVVNACLGPINFQTQDASSVATNVTSNTAVSLTSNGTGTFYSDNACTASITSVLVNSGSNSGTFYYKGTARGTGSHQLDIAAPDLTSASQAQTIDKADQTITFGALANKQIDDVDFAVSATASSGLTVSFGSQTPATCTVTGTTVAIDAVGTCTIRASQAGNGDYNAAPNQDQSFSIGKAPGSVSINNIPGVGVAIIGGSFDPAYTKAGDGTASTTSLTLGICTVVGGTVNFIAAGQCDLQASVTEGTAHLAANGTTQSFSIGKAPGSVSINNIPGVGVAVFGGSFVPAYTKSGDGTASTASLSLATCTVSGGTVNFIAAGECDLQASVTEGTAHLAAVGSTQSFTIESVVSSTGVTGSPNPSVTGQSVTFTAVVTQGANVPLQTGAVTFRMGSSDCTDGTVIVGAVAVNGAGVATASRAFNASESGAQIRACYVSGNSSIGPSNGTTTQVVNQAATTTTIGSNNNPSQFSQSVTFTATVSVASPGTGVPSGNVNFYEFTAGQSCSSLAGAVAIGTQAVAAGSAAITTSALSVGTHPITACYVGDTNFMSSGSSLVSQVVNPLTTSTVLAVAPASQQYSDSTVFTATVTPYEAGVQQLTGTVHFYVGAGIQACGISAPGGAVGSDVIADVDNGVGTFRYEIGNPAGAYKVTACFYSSNASFASSNDDENLTVTTENATVYDVSYSPNPLQVPTPAGTFTFKVKETNPETNGPNLTGAGNIDLAHADVELKGILSPSQSYDLDCNTGSVGGTTGYNRHRVFSCVLPAGIAPDTYEAVITVNTNGYYAGVSSSVVQVTDPNAGFATGGGWYTADNGDKVNFGFMAKASVNNKKTVYQGSLLVIRHTATGQVIRAKSNVFDGYSTKTFTGGGSSTFTGKANYSIDGVSLGNFSFTGYAEDRGTPGVGVDEFGLYLASAGNQVATSSTLSGLVNSAKVLEGGNVQVPQPGKK